MSKHTPGPWNVKDAHADCMYIAADQGKGWNNPTVCQLYEDVTPEDSVTIGPWLEAFPNAEANARLIAAAPDLLEALKLMLEMWEDDPAYGDDHAQKAYAAIKKATGEQE